MVQFLIIDKKINPFLTPFCQDLSYPKSLISLPYFPYIRNVNELFYDALVITDQKILLVMKLHIFCSSEKYLL